MFDIDLIIAFSFMMLLFLRQISILKQPNKINYAPLMVTIGAIGSVVHFILHPDVTNVILLLRESFLPLLVGLLLYLIMNILHQTQKTQEARTYEEFAQLMSLKISELKEFMGELEVKMILARAEDMKIQEDMQERFKHDIKALDSIQVNQSKFLDKFDEMDEWHKNVTKGFEDFTNVQLPELDGVVHKHIDILRVSEQDHYNKIRTTLEKAVESRYDMSEDIDILKEQLLNISNISNSISKKIVEETLNQLSGVTKSFQSQLITLKSHSEGIGTSLYESENRLNGIKEQSEMIMKQMVLSSKKMSDLAVQNTGMHDLYANIKSIVNEVENIKTDYVKAQAQLGSMASDMSRLQEDEMDDIKKQMEALFEILPMRIDEALDKLNDHYHIASDNITQSVQALSKKAQLQKGYTELDN